MLSSVAMIRGLVVVLLVASTATAAPTRRVIEDVPAQPTSAAVSNVLYLERCRGDRVPLVRAVEWVGGCGVPAEDCGTAVTL